MDQRPWHPVACHCGSVRFHVRLVDEFNTARRCTCSYCRMRGAVVVTAYRSDLEFVSGEDNLSTYQFHTLTAKHHFCRTCGIHTHARRRSNPELLAINVACIEGVSPFDFAEVKVVDGTSHPADVGGEAKVAGTLRFVR